MTPPRRRKTWSVLRRLSEAFPCPARPVWRGPAAGRTPSPPPSGPEAALFRRSREPRRGVGRATRRGPPRRGRPPLPRPPGPRPPRRADSAFREPARTARPIAWKPSRTRRREPLASSDREAPRGSGSGRQAAARPPGGAKPPRQAPPPCPRRSAPTAAPPRPTPARHPTRSAVLTEASGTARRTESRKARRLRPRLPARTPLPCSRPPGASAAGWRRSPRPPRPTPARRKPITPSAPTRPTGKCSPPGCAARVFRRRRPIRKRSASISPPKSSAAARSFRSPPSSGGCRASPGATASSAQPLDIRDRHIATVLAGIRRRHGRPPLQKAAIFADELLAMLATLDMDLRGLRDRAILAIGFAGGLRRSEIVGLDCGPARPKTAPAGSKSSPKARSSPSAARPAGARSRSAGARARDTCPVALLETWMRLGRIAHGPLFRAVARKNGGVRIGAAHGQACRPAW